MVTSMKLIKECQVIECPGDSFLLRQCDDRLFASQNASISLPRCITRGTWKLAVDDRARFIKEHDCLVDRLTVERLEEGNIAREELVYGGVVRWKPLQTSQGLKTGKPHGGRVIFTC